MGLFEDIEENYLEQTKKTLCEAISEKESIEEIDEYLSEIVHHGEDLDWLFDRKELAEKYKGRWVVVYGKRVIKDAETYEELNVWLDQNKDKIPKSVIHYFDDRDMMLLCA
ncbi:MAG: DUF5678 domain-containing protein [Nanoarchaeota archaeon]